MLATKWTKGWEGLYEAMGLVLAAYPYATQLTIETSDQGHYGFVVNGITVPGRDDLSRDPAEWPGDLEQIIDQALCDVDWDGVVGESKSGHAVISLVTRSVFAILAGATAHSLKVYGTTDRLDEAEAVYDRLAAQGAARLRLLEFQVPTSWGDLHVVRHANEMCWWETNGCGVTIHRDSARPFTIDPNTDLAAVYGVIDRYVTAHPSSAPQHNTFRALWVRGALETYADQVSDEQESLADVIADLLADLMHLLQFADPGSGVAFESILARAGRRFGEELAGR
jgi:hypothetical protein